MLDNLSEKISHFGNYVLYNWLMGTKSHENDHLGGMVYGLKELGGNIKL